MSSDANVTPASRIMDMPVPSGSPGSLGGDRSGINPVEQLQLLTGAHYVARCVHIVADMGLADALGDQPAPIGALAAQTHCHADALHRILRLLSAYGVFSEENGLISHTPVSRLLRSDHPAGFRHFVRMIGLPVNWQAVEKLEISVRTGEAALPQTLPEGFWSYFERHPEEAGIFDAAMGAKAGAQMGGILGAYDFSPFKVLVDLGGGRGHLLHAVLEGTRETHGILFDLPHVVAAARDALSHPRLEFVGGDFFSDALPQADGYLLMEVLHDWTDDQAEGILASVRRAAPRGARLLVIETVPPPDPGPAWAKILDILMLALFAGKQRTRQEYERLLSARGFELAREVDTGAGITLFEAVAV